MQRVVCCSAVELASERPGLRCRLGAAPEAVEAAAFQDAGNICCDVHEVGQLLRCSHCAPGSAVRAQLPRPALQGALAEGDVETLGLPLEVVDDDGAVLYKGTASTSVLDAKAPGVGGGEPGAPAPTSPQKKPSLQDKYGALLPFAIISTSYLLFTITDGAVRMIVLLHAYSKGFTALQVAIMFTLYELAGVVTNLAAGLLGARWGIKTTLLAGLTVQLAGLAMLFGWQNSWSKTTAILYVTASQALCGVAKDLTKLGGKTVTKLVTPEGRQSQLFKLVSLITGWKNSLKGVGYFLGAVTVGVK